MKEQFYHQDTKGTKKGKKKKFFRQNQAL